MANCFLVWIWIEHSWRGQGACPIIWEHFLINSEVSTCLNMIWTLEKVRAHALLFETQFLINSEVFALLNMTWTFWRGQEACANIWKIPYFLINNGTVFLFEYDLDILKRSGHMRYFLKKFLNKKWSVSLFEYDLGHFEEVSTQYACAIIWK